MAKTEIINAPTKVFYETEIEWVASAIDAHNSNKFQQSGNICLYSGWFHASADIAAGTTLFKTTLPSGRWPANIVAFAFSNPGDLQLLRANSTGVTTAYSIDQVVTSGSYINIVIIAIAM